MLVKMNVNARLKRLSVLFAGRGKKREDGESPSSVVGLLPAGGVMSCQPQGGSELPCSCKASSSSLIGGSGAGWEGTALLHHGCFYHQINLGSVLLYLIYLFYSSNTQGVRSLALPHNQGQYYLLYLQYFHLQIQKVDSTRGT